MIPHLLLEEINAGEKNAKDYYGKYGKEELDYLVKAIKSKQL